MEQFCKDVITFLESEYEDSYKFSIERHISASPSILPGSEHTKLIVTVNPGYQLIIVDYVMQHLFDLCTTGEFIKERDQYRWQKELIDMIEGG